MRLEPRVLPRRGVFCPRQWQADARQFAQVQRGEAFRRRGEVR